MKRRTIRLTERQYQMLMQVLSNGFADGDYFGLNDDPPFSSRVASRRDVDVWNKLLDALGVPERSGAVYRIEYQKP